MESAWRNKKSNKFIKIIFRHLELFISRTIILKSSAHLLGLSIRERICVNLK